MTEDKEPSGAQKQNGAAEEELIEAITRFAPGAAPDQFMSHLALWEDDEVSWSTRVTPNAAARA